MVNIWWNCNLYLLLFMWFVFENKLIPDIVLITPQVFGDHRGFYGNLQPKRFFRQLNS